MVYFPLTRSEGDISRCPFYPQNKEQDEADLTSQTVEGLHEKQLHCQIHSTRDYASLILMPN